MNYLPTAFLELATSFAKIPGVGNRTAERYAYAILKADKRKAIDLSESLASLHDNIKTCPMTFTLIDSSQDVSPLYSDPTRDKSVVAVVAEPFDVIALEKTLAFKGTYHVLGGLISPIDGIEPEHLKLKELKTRITTDCVTELILATNASVEGETTALYVQRMLVDMPNVKVTRIARGLPIGVDLEYADQITLSRALEGRQEF
jgi:recombination protein RecR